MEGILHRQVEVNGIKMHVAEKGEGPVVLLIHGFPELWYSWRHQIVSLASHGYRAVAPDLRGYGDTDAPQAIGSYTINHMVGDLISLIDTLGVDKVFVVGHDWGAIIAWNLCLFRPDRVKALVILSVPFLRRNPSCKPVDAMRKRFGDDYYICRFQAPGEMEAEFAKVPTAFIIRNILTTRKPGPVMSPRAKHSAASDGPPPPLPSWLSQEDIHYYARKFNKKGFTGPLNYYRNFDTNWELTAPYTGAQVKVPTKFITGNEDMVYTTPENKEYIHSNAFKEDVPFLQDVIVMEGAGHFINQEKPDEITKHIYEFIKYF